MDVRFFVDIEDGAGNPVGDGPVIELVSWRSVDRFSRAGTFEFVMSASSPRAFQIQEKRFVRCWAITSGGPVQVGAGIIHKIQRIPQQGGNILMRVSGPNIVGELLYRNMFNATASNVTHAAAVAQIAALAPPGWTFIADPTPPNDDIYHEYRKETVLSACITIAKLSGNGFYLSGEREITFASTWDDSGIRAIEPKDGADIEDPDTAYIANVQYTDEAKYIASRIYPYGAEGVTLADTTRTAPAGYTLDTVNNYIRNNAIETTYGRIESVNTYNDVKPIAATPADDIAASNALFDLALADLQLANALRRDFNLSLFAVPKVLRPLESIRCIFRRVANGLVIEDIDQQLFILEAETEVSAKGLRTTRLIVGTVQQPPRQDTDPILDLMREYVKG